MRILSRIIFVAMLAMAVIIIPLGAATIIMAIELGLLFEALSGMLMLCVYIALSLYEVREFIAETEWEQQELNGAGGEVPGSGACPDTQLVRTALSVCVLSHGCSCPCTIQSVLVARSLRATNQGSPVPSRLPPTPIPLRWPSV